MTNPAIDSAGDNGAAFGKSGEAIAESKYTGTE